MMTDIPEPSAETHDEDTLRKVYDATRKVVGSVKATNCINAMQNAGILFRERVSDSTVVQGDAKLSENSEPPETDAAPDDAFELGRVAGYDEAMREVAEGEPSDDDLMEIYQRAVDDAMHAANLRDGFGSNMSRESIVAGLRAVARVADHGGEQA